MDIIFRTNISRVLMRGRRTVCSIRGSLRKRGERLVKGFTPTSSDEEIVIPLDYFSIVTFLCLEVKQAFALLAYSRFEKAEACIPLIPLRRKSHAFKKVSRDILQTASQRRRLTAMTGSEPIHHGVQFKSPYEEGE